MANEQFFKGHPGPKAQRAASQAADRPGGEFQEPGALAIDAEFGVQRTVAEAQGMGGLFGVLDDLGLQVRAEARRGDVERFFKKGAIQRVGLVEQGERLQTARGQHALQGDLGAGNEPFDEDALVRLVLFLANLRAFQQGAQAKEGGNKRRWRIGAHDAAARRQGEGFHDARIRHLVLHETRVGLHGETREGGHARASRLQALAHEELVAAGQHGVRRVVQQTQGPARIGGAEKGGVAHGRMAVTGRRPAKSTMRCAASCGRSNRSGTASSSQGSSSTSQRSLPSTVSTPSCRAARMNARASYPVVA